MTVAAAAPDPILQLWAHTRTWLARAVDAFGGPAAIARLVVRGARRVAARQLAACEALVMKLLLVEAADLSPQAFARGPGARTQTQSRPTELDLAHPETWNVRFIPRLPSAPPTPQQQAGAGPRIRSFAQPLLVRDIAADRARQELHARMKKMRDARWRLDPARDRAKAERLARRFEALRRVFADPKPYALRLKRKVLALAAKAYDAAMRIVLKRVPAAEIDPKAATLALIESARAVPEMLKPPSG
jgi:hypothetical protein